MSNEKIAAIEHQIYELAVELRSLQQDCSGHSVQDYTFKTTEGTVTLRELFGDKDKLLVIHNMGQACRYCTLWGDGLNPFVTHLETEVALVMLSKDDPQTQRRFANSRNWRFRMASHDGSDYLTEQIATSDYENAPGIVCYHLENGSIVRRASSLFGPGDLYCSMWHTLGIAGINIEHWTPQYNYWQRPAEMEDGGENLID